MKEEVVHGPWSHEDPVIVTVRICVQLCTRQSGRARWLRNGVLVWPRKA